MKRDSHCLILTARFEEGATPRPDRLHNVLPEPAMADSDSGAGGFTSGLSARSKPQTRGGATSWLTPPLARGS